MGIVEQEIYLGLNTITTHNFTNFGREVRRAEQFLQFEYSIHEGRAWVTTRSQTLGNR